MFVPLWLAIVLFAILVLSLSWLALILAGWNALPFPDVGSRIFIPWRFNRLVGTSVVAATFLGCQPNSAATPDVLIPGTDYAFQVPSELPAGPTRFQFANRGLVPHEMALGQLRSGVSAESLLAYAAAGHNPGDLADGIVGILIAQPGTTAMGTLSADLVPGRTYMMICNFRDADSLPPHIVMGMQASFVAR